MYGLIAVTISFLAIVRQMDDKPLPRPATASSRLSPTERRRSDTTDRTRRIGARSRSKHAGRITAKSSRTGKAPRRLPSKPQGEAILQPMIVTSDAPKMAAVVLESVSECPTCRLQAPQALMMEHFLASPSHEEGTTEQLPVIIDGKIPEESNLVSSEEDLRNSMRHLLQMLVPPRAFGRRHLHRTVNPLSHVIRTLEASRGDVLHPL